MGTFFGFASKITRITPLNTSNNTISNGETIRIWGFSVSNTGVANCAVIFFTNETVPKELMSVFLQPNQTVIVPIPFVAGKGLLVQASLADTVSVTVWHDQSGV